MHDDYLRDLFEAQAHDSWRKLMCDEFDKPYFEELSLKVRLEAERGNILPEPQSIFRAFRLVPFDGVKVVMLAQDPYPDRMYSDGLAFSAGRSSKLPGSLKNIYDEIDCEFSFDSNRKADLSHWAEEGVLLLNSALTIGATKLKTNGSGARSHNESHLNWGWRKWTDEVIARLSDKRWNLVFILLGNYSIAKKSLVSRECGHLVLEAAHPSPLSASRGFFHSGIFVACNDFLSKRGIRGIDWCNRCLF